MSPEGHGGRRAVSGRKPAMAIPARGTALLLIDVINDLAFEGSAALVAEAESMASRLATLKRRASAAGVPSIYINDNFGAVARSSSSNWRRAERLPSTTMGHQNQTGTYVAYRNG